VRNDAVDSETPLLVFLVSGEIALEPFDMPVAFEGEHRGRAEAVIGAHQAGWMPPVVVASRNISAQFRCPSASVTLTPRALPMRSNAIPRSKAAGITDKLWSVAGIVAMIDTVEKSNRRAP